MYICDGAIRWWCEWAVMCTATAPAKVGIIISLTLNKWPSRERETEVDNENGMKAGGWGERSPRLQTGHRNFHITHLCAIFKLTIVNFFLLLCRFLFFYAKRRNKTRESKKNGYLTVCLLKNTFSFFFGFSGTLETVQMNDKGYIQIKYVYWRCVNKLYSRYYFPPLITASCSLISFYSVSLLMGFFCFMSYILIWCRDMTIANPGYYRGDSARFFRHFFFCCLRSSVAWTFSLIFSYQLFIACLA